MRKKMVSPKKKKTKISAQAAVKNKRTLIKKSKGAKKHHPFLERFAENPIILPRAENEWEDWQTFNPGVILLGGKVHFLYRAIGKDGISRFGYAASNDGFCIDERLPYPVYEHLLKQHSFNIFSYISGGSFGGCEDPRIVQVSGENVLYMTYTACDEGLRVGLTSIKVDDFLNKNWEWSPPVLISPQGQIHKNWVIFPEKINGKYAILHSINPEISIAYLDNLEFSGSAYIKSYYSAELKNGSWDSWIRGVGAPPIKTKYGWLVFYHAMAANDFSKYKVGAMLLDLKDPTIILRRAKQPVLEPTEYYENSGFKAGVIYVSGAVIKNGKLIVYYGGSDTVVCAASVKLDEFLEDLMKNKGPKLKPLNKIKTIKK